MHLARSEFERLLLEQTDLLYRMAHRLTRNRLKAEDLVQETFLRAIRSADNFDLADYGIKPWLLRIMRNLHISRGEREARQPMAAENESLETALPPSLDTPIDPASFEMMDEQLVAALDGLSEDYRTALLLWAVEEFSYKEIADALEVPIGTVMSRLHRARQQLAQKLKGFAQETGFVRE